VKVRIGTRGSDLALWQARHIAGALERAGLQCELIVLKTRGDVIDDVPLTGVEGKAFFTAEIERALLDGAVDLAVHSHKDLPTDETPGLTIAAVPKRGALHERLLVARAAHAPGAAFLPLRRGASVGTSAPRRTEQLRTLRPDLELRDLRGNVPTRVRKLRDGLYDAILLAAAGLDRLALPLDDLELLDLPIGLFVPAPAQGALAVQARAGDAELMALCRRHLHHEPTARAIEAERGLLEAAGGGCNLPLGAALDVPDENDLAIDGDAPRFRARAFLGADHPRGAEHGRWSEATADDPLSAARAAFARLASAAPTACGPLAPLRVALTGSASEGSLLAQRLSALGARVCAERVLEFEPLPEVDLGPHLSELAPGDALVVTSRQVAPALARHRRPRGLRVAVVGPACERALAEAGWKADLVGNGGARDLARALAMELLRDSARADRRVLFPCGQEAERVLERTLAASGFQVQRVEVYRTIRCTDVALDPSVDARIYMSGSAVEAALTFERDHAQAGVARFAFGATSSAALERAGLDHARPGGNDDGLMEELVHLLARLRPRLQPQP
jgi:hydroxymethylbilane synthase